ncbi:MAG: hypothetical protein Kow0010_14680 [Dehalococcoidia bacterium]
MTSLTRWNPFDELRLAWPWPRDLFARVGGTTLMEWNPRCDVTERDDAIVVHAELPGVNAEDMSVEVQGNRLSIRGEKKEEKSEEKEGQRTYSERFFGSFERVLTLPPDVDESGIEATLRDGVLEVLVPRTKRTSPAGKKIQIRKA